jgi:four helix bundle protein
MDKPSSSVRSFRDLRVWQRAMDLAELVYEATRGLPEEEMYGLTSQMRRCAVSIASNISEGHSRQTRDEYIQFLGNARGSLAELYTQATLATRLKKFKQSNASCLEERITEVGRLLNALRKSLIGPAAKKSSPNPNP